ncbi:hypothetical protein SMAC4_13424 [Sordaria macrospora]|uniref:uncharacterized protein n=1 Tax=Sordaria macrospora TaxID=5147 RepID=UPI002B27EC6E|nr:hypothetical protein SMAC4_13424 [Sordaria macrospora]
MIQALTGRYSSNFGLALTLSAVMDLSVKDRRVVLQSTPASLADDVEDGKNQYAVLVNAIPSGLRDSLIQGTLAYDCVKNASRDAYELHDRVYVWKMSSKCVRIVQALLILLLLLGSSLCPPSDDRCERELCDIGCVVCGHTDDP